MNVSYKNPRIIVIAGKARSGKNTVGDILKKLYQNDHKKVIISPYTKYLKEYIKEITGLNFNDDNKPRELLQQLGIEIIKDKLGKKDMLISRNIDDIDIYSYFFDVIIIPDARFPREIEVVKEKYKNVTTIKVTSTRENNLTNNEKKHITETSLDNYLDNNFDYIINNDNDDLQEKVNYIYKDINS